MQDFHTFCLQHVVYVSWFQAFKAGSNYTIDKVDGINIKINTAN